MIKEELQLYTIKSHDKVEKKQRKKTIMPSA